ncbi:sigma-70 region 4 domain-containing protein [Stakelama saccharophila]|uniref:Sigma-70 region 4 domain-containing protein n=1 Tax=Stakelama saccharophila TaxID=3075605 RepID=A0ABZ0B951_9SPHN|nr:sigma-70 region 4 domain-containing protein [Stakelama sp. W311]WNO53641.1 sigma-70 region 4 domain-containing protein [Stakelama sp. W311]
MSRASDALARSVAPLPERIEGEPDPQAVARLDAALRSLRRIDREIFLAHRLDAMSYAEIARRTGLSAAQVQRRMAWALYAISRHMDGTPLPWWRRWF